MVKRWLSAALLSAACLTLLAQGAPPPPPPAPNGQRDMAARRDTVRLYLVHRMREALALSDAQTLKVLDVLEAIDKAREAHQLALRTIMARLRAEVDDPATTEGAFADTVAEVQKEQVQFEERARGLEGRLLAILSPRQQAQFILLRRQLQEEIRQDLAPGGRAGRPGRWR